MAPVVLKRYLNLLCFNGTGTTKGYTYLLCINGIRT